MSPECCETLSVSFLRCKEENWWYFLLLCCWTASGTAGLPLGHVASAVLPDGHPGDLDSLSTLFWHPNCPRSAVLCPWLLWQTAFACPCPSVSCKGCFRRGDKAQKCLMQPFCWTGLQIAGTAGGGGVRQIRIYSHVDECCVNTGTASSLISQHCWMYFKII